jgi:hypothetical protein
VLTGRFSMPPTSTYDSDNDFGKAERRSRIRYTLTSDNGVQNRYLEVYLEVYRAVEFSLT